METMRGDIIDGRLSPGQKLTEAKLSAALGISRTPLREALFQLEQEGLLTRNRGGYSVASFSLPEVIDAIELRGFLEGAAVRCAAERGVAPAKLKSVEAILGKLDRAVAAVDHKSYGKLNTKFHEELAGLAGSKMLQAEVLRSYRFPFAHPSGFPTNLAGKQHLKMKISEGQAQHRAIVELIKSGDGKAAAEAMLMHARHAIANVEAAYLEKVKTNRVIAPLSLVT
ncbi:MAG: GntR family transcriptional regulator [Pseudomonadota bacterium]